MDSVVAILNSEDLSSSAACISLSLAELCSSTRTARKSAGFQTTGASEQHSMTVSVTYETKSAITSTAKSTMMALAMGRPSSPGNSSGSDNDCINNSTTATALRRLYFKSGRNAKTKTATIAATSATVPKVVVMGSSTTSTTDINTSTESASTLITNVTVTDTSETYDSLDLGDTSGQSEPLLSSLDEPNQTSTSMGSDQEITELELTSVYSKQDISILDNLEEESSLTIPETTSNIPRTAPISTSSAHFPFDPPSSPRSVKTFEKNESLFTFKDAVTYLEQQHKVSDQKGNYSEKNDSRKYLPQQKYFHQQQQQRKLSSSAYDKEIKLNSWNWDSEPDKENKKRKEISSTKLEKLKDEIVRDKNNSNNGIDDVKKQKKDTKLQSKSNKYFEKLKTSPKHEKYRNTSKICSAPAVTNRKDRYHQCYGSSPKHSDITYDQKDLTMFPFDREAIDYERIQKECFTVGDSTTKFAYNFEENDSNESDSTSDSDNSVCEGKLFGSPSKSEKFKNDIFQQYTLLSQQESFQSYEKRQQPKTRNRPDLIQKKYDHVTKSDAFTPKPVTLGENNSPSPRSVKDLNKFEEIANKFDQMAAKTTESNNENSLVNSSPSFINTFHGSNTSLSNNQSSSQTINPTNSNSSVSRGTPPLPDLRIDFFLEPLNDKKKEKQSRQITKQELHDNLDECQKSSQNSGAINVTSNPMEVAVCTQPRATIVVQQPSLSLDNTVETLLLKDEGEFEGVEKSRKKKQHQLREENMRQLLDVTNTLTFEELRDFEMRYGSPHHCRSQSVKTPRASGRPNQLTLPQQRSRVASMPNTGVEEEYYRLRHFSITGKGVINRGDSLKSRRSRSNNSVRSNNSSNSSTEHLTATVQVVQPCPGSARTSATCSLASSRESSTSNPGNVLFRVLMLGGSAVGKSSLVSQFMTSEYLHAYDTSIDDESGEKAVSVLLNGEESELIFIDHPSTEISPENCLSSYDPHGYCVIYSSADRGSFAVAEMVLQALWTTENIAQKAVILVGNKADLARSRTVSSDEGKAMATAYDCKFIETSVGINHNVDELLVGLLSQIRLKLENPEKSRDLFRKRSSRRNKRACSPLGVPCLSGGNNPSNPSTPVGPNPLTEGTPPGSAQSSPRKYRGSRTSTSLKVKGLLGRVWARDSKSKSCENLHVL